MSAIFKNLTRYVGDGMRYVLNITGTTLKLIGTDGSESSVLLPSPNAYLRRDNHHIVGHVNVSANLSLIGTTTITKSGWSPMGIVGWKTGNSDIVLTRLDWYETGTDGAIISYELRNLTGYVRDAYLDIDFLWMRQ